MGYTRVRETQHLSEAAEGKGSYRCVGRITSADFRHWSAQEIVFEADEEDLQIPVPFQRDDPRPNIDFYTSCATKYDAAQDAYFMLPAAYYHWGEDDFPATMDVQLLSSRDGINWQRQGERRAFLRQELGRRPVERDAVCQSVVYSGGRRVVALLQRHGAAARW